MKKALLLIILACIAVYTSSCTIDDVLDLGGYCDGVSYIEQSNGQKCYASDTNSTNTECNSYHTSGVFTHERCPNNYQCVTGDEGDEIYCECITPCGSSCCTQGTVCNKDTNTCMPPNHQCTKDEDCEHLDITLPYCNAGICVACTNDSDCTGDLRCENNTCIECSQDKPCNNGLQCTADGKCVECLSNEAPTCNPSDPQSVLICVDGERQSVACPAQTPFCHLGECLECMSHENCTENNDTGYCINNKCLDCMTDSDCTGRINADGIFTTFCLDNQCASCKTDENCKDSELPYCNASLGQCAACSENTPAQCNAQQYQSCDIETGTFIYQDCPSICTPEGCIDCNTDDDCQGNLKYCTDDKKCIQCRDNTDCETGVCHTETNQCVECLEDSDCKTNGNNTCDKTYRCISLCTQDSDCPENYKCHEKACVLKPTDGKCYDNSDCTNPNTPVCDTTQQICVACLSTSDCTNNPNGKVCDPTTHTCYGCLSPDDCPTGQVCSPTTNRCVQCNVNTDCSTNACANHICVECDNNHKPDCYDGKRRTCVNNKWQYDACSGKGCTNGACNICTPGTTQCNGTDLKTCNSTGQWETLQSCGSRGCFSNSRCGNCIANATECSGDNLRTCSNGNWQTTSCPYGCSAGACIQAECSSGSYSCESNALYKCVNGFWSRQETCTFGCSGGSCNTPQYVKITNYGNTSMKEPGADIDAVVVTRNGSQFYADDVISASYCIESPDAALYEPDSFTGYPNTGNCRASSTNWTPYAIMGDSGSTLVLKLSKPMKNGDYLEVLEVGNCALTSGTIAGADTIKVEYGNNSEWQYCNQQTGPSVGCTISF